MELCGGFEGCGEQRKAEGIILLGRERKGQQTLARQRTFQPPILLAFLIFTLRLFYQQLHDIT